jgi:hypothetical protein
VVLYSSVPTLIACVRSASEVRQVDYFHSNHYKKERWNACQCEQDRFHGPEAQRQRRETRRRLRQELERELAKDE